jgi:hypothetical protein
MVDTLSWRTWPCQAPALSSNPVSHAFDYEISRTSSSWSDTAETDFSTNIKPKGKNMKRIIITIGLCLVSVVAISAVAAGSASAEPALLLKLTKGAFPVTYLLVTDGNDTFETASGDKISCTKTEGDGEFANPHLGMILFIVTGCEVEATVLGIKIKGPCNTVEEHSKEGLIMLDDWMDQFGGVKLSNGKEDPGTISLRPEKYEIECHTSVGVIKTVIAGAGVVGLIMTLEAGVPKVGTPYPMVNLVLKGTKGVQEDTEFLLPLNGNEILKTSLTANVDGSGVENIALSSTAHIGEFKNSTGEATEIEIIEG